MSHPLVMITTGHHKNHHQRFHLFTRLVTWNYVIVVRAACQNSTRQLRIGSVSLIMLLVLENTQHQLYLLATWLSPHPSPYIASYSNRNHPASHKLWRISFSKLIVEPFVNVEVSVVLRVLNYINVQFETLHFHPFGFTLAYVEHTFNFWKTIRKIKMYLLCNVNYFYYTHAVIIR